jgi:hypothetical protein
MAGWLARGETTSYRVYEIAGVPHIWKGLTDFAALNLGALRQNPASLVPVNKAMLAHLHAWIASGTPPPPTVTLPGAVVPLPEGDRAATPCTAPCSIYQVERDAYGNALGGVRLPRLVVPIGTYTGTEAFPSPPYPSDPDEFSRAVPQPYRVSLGGTFTPFSRSVLESLYPTHGSYLRRMSDAAAEARDAGHILGEDVGRYVSEGAHLTIGMPATDEGVGL